MNFKMHAHQPDRSSASDWWVSWLDVVAVESRRRFPVFDLFFDTRLRCVLPRLGFANQ